MVSRKEFDTYVEEMWIRLKEGERKYGNKYKSTNIVREMLAESVDLSNYSFLLYLQAKRTNLVKGGQNEYKENRRSSKSYTSRNR